MRLINATELEKRSDEEMFEINKYTLRLAPTVDAIPVEWIKIWAKDDKYTDDYKIIVARPLIRHMIADWRKEND